MLLLYLHSIYMSEMVTDSESGYIFGSRFEFLGKTGAGFSMYGIMYIECTYTLHSYSKNIKLKPLHSLFHPNEIFRR